MVVISNIIHFLDFFFIFEYYNVGSMAMKRKISDRNN